MNTPETIKLSTIIPLEYQGKRLDQVAAALFPDYSRAKIQEWIKKGELLLNEKPAKSKDKVAGGETITIEAEITKEVYFAPELIELNIIYEDDDLLIINKPAGLVVHPGAGNQSGTLLNALLHHCPELETIPRAGIVHRLDKDTTGIMMVAKTLPAHTFLVSELQARKVQREYEAVIKGVLTSGGTIDEPIGRHPSNRIKMAVTESGKPAVTHYRIIKRFDFHTHVQIKLETGRTHQIRVHMTHKHLPLIGDKVYGGRDIFKKGMSDELKEVIKNFPRQALHAKKLTLMHPRTKEEVSWEAPLPEDMVELLKKLENV